MGNNFVPGPDFGTDSVRAVMVEASNGETKASHVHWYARWKKRKYCNPAVNLSLSDMGARFSMIVNEVNTVAPEHDILNLPVARVLWDPKPNLEVAATSWILAGGAHHTVFSKALTTGFFEDFFEIAGIELLVIDE